MSLPDQEARALDRAQQFLWDLGSGTQPINGHVREIRALARDISRHYPLAAGALWIDLHEGDGE